VDFSGLSNHRELRTKSDVRTKSKVSGLELCVCVCVCVCVGLGWSSNALLFTFSRSVPRLQYDRIKGEYMEAIEKLQKQLHVLNPNLKATEKFQDAESMLT
jgi:hypothetical protein